MKVSDHWVRSPLLNIARACQACHPYPEAELQARVEAIQDRTHALMRAVGGGADRHARRDRRPRRRPARPSRAARRRCALQRKAQWRLDFVAAENSMGFHAPAGGGAHPGRVDRLRAAGAARGQDGGGTAAPRATDAGRTRFAAPRDSSTANVPWARAPVSPVALVGLFDPFGAQLAGANDHRDQRVRLCAGAEIRSRRSASARSVRQLASLA